MQNSIQNSLLNVTDTELDTKLEVTDMELYTKFGVIDC